MTKDHILAEIQRTADANGGVPLGKARFFAETGIKESDWHGRFWVRWNDAIKEAGLQPNQLNAAMSDEDLLSALAALLKELGHFPVKAEIKLKARSAPGFPSFNTFARFGNKQGLAAKLHAFLLDRGETDLAALCDPFVAKAADEPETPQEPYTDAKLGWVYLVRAGRYYKIGCSNSVGRREYELAIQLPEKPNLVHKIRTDDPRGIEAYWHRRFADNRKNGEWFELAASDVRAFNRRKFM